MIHKRNVSFLIATILSPLAAAGTCGTIPPSAKLGARSSCCCACPSGVCSSFLSPLISHADPMSLTPSIVTTFLWAALAKLMPATCLPIACLPIGLIITAIGVKCYFSRFKKGHTDFDISLMAQIFLFSITFYTFIAQTLKLTLGNRCLLLIQCIQAITVIALFLLKLVSKESDKCKTGLSGIILTVACTLSLFFQYQAGIPNAAIVSLHFTGAGILVILYIIYASRCASSLKVVDVMGDVSGSEED